MELLKNTTLKGFQLKIIDRKTVSNRKMGAYCHVRFAAGVYGLGDRVDEVARDAKVTHLHLASPVHEDV